MTLALRILKLLADKRARTRDQIAQELNADIDQVQNSLIHLRNVEMTHAAHVYGLTDKGFERSKFQPKPPYVRKRPERPYVRKEARNSAGLSQVWMQQ